MSSPLNSLSKVKKSPLTRPNHFGKPTMPFRSSEYTAEQELLDDVTTRLASQSILLPTKSSISDSAIESLSSRNLANHKVSAAAPNPLGVVRQSREVSKAPNDLDLMSTMMKRISQLEAQITRFSKDVVEKDKKIKALEDKLALMTKAQGISDAKSYSYTDDLETKCAEMQEQIYEMEAFLADYGMIWVGDKTEIPDESATDDVTSQTVTSSATWQPGLSFPSSFQVDYDLIIKNVNDLNVIAGEGVSHIEKTKDGARLKIREPVSLTLYENGIILFNGPFRSFEDLTTQRCLGDIMDGFFPTELQKRYPDGVPIKVNDKRRTHFQDRRLLAGFPGVGRTLRDDDSSNTVETQVAHGNRDDVTSELPAPRVSTEQFLDNLPKSVIRGSKVVDVRSSVRDVLKGAAGGQNVTTQIVETEEFQEMQKRMELPENERPQSARDITTIRVKSEDGLKTFVLKMKFSDTIGDLRKYIDKQRNQHDRTYEIVSTFPRQTHSDDSRTLQVAGLTPNATLHLKART